MKVKSTRVTATESRNGTGWLFGKAHWLLLAIFFMVLAQMLMSLPIVKRWSASISGPAPKEIAASQKRHLTGAPKPWGDIECEPFILEPPDEFISNTPLPADERDWHFTADTHKELQAEFSSFDLTSEQKGMLQDAAKWRSSTNGFYFSPESRLVLTLSPRARQQIYSLLAASSKNVYQFNPFCFHAGTVEEHFADSEVPYEALGMVKSLLYQRDQSMCFSDISVFDDLPVRDRRRLLKTLTRIPVVFMKLRLTPESDLDALVSYWGKQGNAKHVKPLLQRLVRIPGGTTIDIAHLLPPFARKRLLTFPAPSPTREWEKQDCFWTAMNFFLDQPDDRVAKLDYTFNSIKKDYFEVQGDPAFGDMLALVSANGKVKHVCTFIADDVVFTKNGGHYLQPWALMKISDMLAKYPADPPLQRIVLRSNKS